MTYQSRNEEIVATLYAMPRESPGVEAQDDSRDGNDCKDSLHNDKSSAILIQHC